MSDLETSTRTSISRDPFHRDTASSTFRDMRGRGAALARLIAWLAFLAVGIIGLHRLGASFPIEAITDPGGPSEPALAAALRLIGLGIGYWLAGSTVLYLIARASRIPAGLRAVRWITLGPIRRVVDGVAAGAVAVSLTMPLSAWALASPSYVPVPAGDSPGATTTAATELPTSTSTSIEVEATLAPDPLYMPVTPAGQLFGENSERVLGADAASPGMAIEVIVLPGEDMWKLAEDHLATLLGRQPTDSETAPYWLQVIGANLNRIRSGDPDLIFPGEVLILPPVK